MYANVSKLIITKHIYKGQVVKWSFLHVVMNKYKYNRSTEMTAVPVFVWTDFPSGSGVEQSSHWVSAPSPWDCRHSATPECSPSLYCPRSCCCSRARQCPSWSSVVVEHFPWIYAAVPGWTLLRGDDEVDGETADRARCLSPNLALRSGGFVVSCSQVGCWMSLSPDSHCQIWSLCADWSLCHCHCLLH